MALWNQGVKEKHLTPVQWEILLCLLFTDKNRSCLTTNIIIIIIIVRKSHFKIQNSILNPIRPALFIQLPGLAGGGGAY